MSGLITPRNMNFVSKRWGWELWIYNGNKYCGKKIFLKQGHYLSFHHHEVKDEVLFVESGLMYMTYGKDTKNVEYLKMGPGYAFHVEPGLKHQMQALKDTTIFEFSTTHSDEDSFRTTTNLVLDHMVDEMEWMR